MKGHFLTILLLLSIRVLAQDSADSKKLILSTNFSVDIDNLNVGDLNNYLLDKGYFVTPNSQLNTVFGLSLRDNTPWIFNLLLFQGEANNEPNEKSSISSFGTRMELLYDLIKNDKWTIAPFVGIQTSDYQLISVSQNVISPLTGNNLEEICQMTDLFQFRPGFLIDRKLRISFLDLYLGMQISYCVQIGSDSWHNSRGEVLNNLPSTNFSGLSVGFTGRLHFNPVGWVRKMSKIKEKKEKTTGHNTT